MSATPESRVCKDKTSDGMPDVLKDGSYIHNSVSPRPLKAFGTGCSKSHNTWNIA